MPDQRKPAAKPAQKAAQKATQKPAQKAVETLRRHRPWLAASLIAVLVAALGFAIAVQVRANSSPDSLSSLREPDLIGLLDDQNARADRLRAQIADLEQSLRQLQTSGDQSDAAKKLAQEQATELAILLGTIAATGPGVVVTITDPQRAVDADTLVDVIAELRGAGAEAIQFGPVRITTDSAFVVNGGQLLVDGQAVSAPYTVIAIGDAATMDTALNIPGGVAATIRTKGGELTVQQRPQVTISAVRSLPQPKYAKPSGH